MIELFAGEVFVHYGFLSLGPDDDAPDLMDMRAGQRNGLCGATIPGVLSLITGMHTGSVPVVIRWHDTEPAVDPDWEDVVEASFRPAAHDLWLASFDDLHEVRMPVVTDLRVRYCAADMDEAGGSEPREPGGPVTDRYQLDLWPAPPEPDAIIRQTSRTATDWHKKASAAPLPPQDLSGGRRHDEVPEESQSENLDLSRGHVTVAEIGQPISVRRIGYDDELQYTVRSIRQAPNIDPDEADTVWLFVDVEAAALTGRVQAMPHDFAFVTSDLSRFWPTGVNYSGELGMTPLRSGQRVSGLVLFQVPASAVVNGRIVVKTVGDEGDVPLGCWTVDEPPARYDGPAFDPWW